MKKVLLIFMVSLAFLSCKKDDENVGGELAETNVLIGEWKVSDPNNGFSACYSKSFVKFTKNSYTKKRFSLATTIGEETCNYEIMTSDYILEGDKITYTPLNKPKEVIETFSISGKELTLKDEYGETTYIKK